MCCKRRLAASAAATLLTVLFLAALCCPSPARAAETTPLKVLVTGFEAFDAVKINPTQALVEFAAKHPDLLLEDVAALGGRIELKAMVLPVLYKRGFEVLREEILRFRPDIVLAFGLIQGSPLVRVESTARNRNGGYPDNEGRRSLGPIDDLGPSELPSTLPVDALATALRQRDIPVERSINAGDYVCNDLFYRLMRFSRQGEAALKGMKAGFIHVPEWPLDGPRGLIVVLRTALGALSQSRTAPAPPATIKPLAPKSFGP